MAYLIVSVNVKINIIIYKSYFRELFSILIYFKIYFIPAMAKLFFFSSHYFSLQCQMILQKSF